MDNNYQVFDLAVTNMAVYVAGAAGTRTAPPKRSVLVKAPQFGATPATGTSKR